MAGSHGSGFRPPGLHQPFKPAVGGAALFRLVSLHGAEARQTNHRYAGARRKLRPCVKAPPVGGYDTGVQVVSAGKAAVLTNKTHSLSHTKWMCKYHIVFTPKYRRKLIYSQYRDSLGEIFRNLCRYKGWR